MGLASQKFFNAADGCWYEITPTLQNDKWITVHPNGEGTKGTHLHIEDGESVGDALQRKFGYAGKGQLSLFKAKDLKQKSKKETTPKTKEVGHKEAVDALNRGDYVELWGQYYRKKDGKVEVLDYDVYDKGEQWKPSNIDSKDYETVDGFHIIGDELPPKAFKRTHWIGDTKEVAKKEDFLSKFQKRENPKGFWIFERDGTAVEFVKNKEEAEKYVDKMLEPIYGERSKNEGLRNKEYKIEEHDENNKKHKTLYEHRFHK